MHSRHTSRHAGFHAHLNVSDLVVGLTREAVRAGASSSSHGCHHGCTHHCSHAPPVQVQQVHHHHHHPRGGGGRRHRAPPAHVAPVVPVYAAPPPQPTGAYIRIVHATYGAGMHQRDVTDVLQRLVLGQGGLSLNAFGSSQSMNALFGDHLHGTRKTLQFSYEVVGQPQALTLPEDRKINLVMGEQFQQSAGCHTQVPPVVSHFDLILLQSSYGFGECRYDVSAVLGAMIAQHGGKGLSAFGYFFSPNGCMNKAFGDPAPGKDKDLRVSYMWRTPIMSCTAAEDQHVCLAYDALRPLL